MHGLEKKAFKPLCSLSRNFCEKEVISADVSVHILPVRLFQLTNRKGFGMESCEPEVIPQIQLHPHWSFS